MRSIIVGFSTSSRFLSRLIRWATQSDVSHTYIRIPQLNHPSRSLVFQASGLVVNVEGDRVFEDHARVMDEFVLNINEDQWIELEGFMLDTLGKPYSIKHLFGLAWVLLLKKLGISVRNPYRDKNHSYVCVELVAKILKIPSPEDLTPQDLLDWCRLNLEP